MSSDGIDGGRRQKRRIALPRVGRKLLAQHPAIGASAPDRGNGELSAPQGSRQNTVHRLRGTASVTASAGEDQLHQEAQTFARRMAQHLAEALQQRRFGALHIVAAPRFLGHLRKELDAMWQRR